MSILLWVIGTLAALYLIVRISLRLMFREPTPWEIAVAAGQPARHSGKPRWWVREAWAVTCRIIRAAEWFGSPRARNHFVELMKRSWNKRRLSNVPG